MGCFSFMCKKCGKAILSSSFRGQEVELFLLKDGRVIQHMSGEYDSYGQVFIKDSQREDVKHPLMKSVEWDDPFPNSFKKRVGIKNGKIITVETDEIDDRDPWSKVCDLMFDNDKSNGIAAIHTKCYSGVPPTTESEDDPNQGWGEDFELFADISDDEVK